MWVLFVASFRACPLAPSVGSLMGCSTAICSSVILDRGCRRISIPVPGAPLPTPSLWCLQGCLSYCCPFCSSLTGAHRGVFYPCLNVITGVPPALLMVSALGNSGSILVLGRTDWLCRRSGRGASPCPLFCLSWHSTCI